MTVEMIDALVKNIKDFGFEKVFGKYYSIYRGQVVSNEDTEQRGRIEVTVPSLFGEESLPTLAEPKDFRGASTGKGEFYPPEVDDWVYIEFEGGDSRFPVYSGGWHATDEASEEFTHVGDVPMVRGFVNKYGHSQKYDETPGAEKLAWTTPKGHIITLDDTEGKEAVYVIHSTGAQLQIDKDGSVKFLAKDGGFINMDAVNGAVTATAKSGAFVTIKEAGIVAQDGTGASFVDINGDGVTVNSSKDVIVNANTATMKVGSFIVDTLLAKMSMGNGLVAVGAGPTELIDQVIKICDAFLNAPVLVTTGVGPSSPLIPPASVALTLVKTLLTTIKGTLP